MAFTDHSDVYGAVHEAGFNEIARHLVRQRPSLFNYGTRRFASNPDLLCRRIASHPEVRRRGNPLLTVEDPLPIAGTGGTLGLDFCLQLTELKIDFHPGDAVELPPELSPPLDEQQLALQVQVCMGMICPTRDAAEQEGDLQADLYPPVGSGKPVDEEREQEEPRPPIRPIPGREPRCFCLDVVATAHLETVGPAADSELAVRLDGLEIVDVRPEGLEEILECYLATTLRVGVLPRVRIALDTISFELGEYANLSVSPTPTSGSLPNNPAIEDDQLKVYIDVGVTP